MAYQECESLEPLGSIDDEIGEIRSFMRNSAPRGWLICDGSSYSTDAYPKLVNLFIQEFGTAYKFGGSGGSFKVPDLRGEFLRGTGTNSHSGNGNGADVGVHQDATKHPRISTGNGLNDLRIGGAKPGVNWGSISDNEDSSPVGSSVNYQGIVTASGSNNNPYCGITSRPTNTSVLYCIRAY